MNKAYSSIAKFYNRLADRDYDAYYDFVKNHIKGDVVELGAGAGRFTTKYIDSVSSATLVDSSGEMLNELNANLKKHRRKSQVILADANEFVPLKKVDTVLAVCDVFNYVKDFGGLIERINGYLKAGGTLIFDISSKYKLQEIIGNNVFFEDYDDVTYLWTNSLSDDSVKMDITVFERDGDVYKRMDETGVQFIIEQRLVEETLTKYGFDCCVVDCDDLASVRENSFHLLFIAHKL